MITTSEIYPSAVLVPFIRCYSFREFDTHGLDVVKSFHATHEMTLPFFFKAVPVKLVCPQSGKILQKGNYTGITGISTQYNGEMTFNGNYAFFAIIFKPAGFNKIFGFSPLEIADQIIDTDGVIGVSVKNLYEQLIEAGSLEKMACLVNEFLLSHLNRQKPAKYKNEITLLIKKYTTLCTVYLKIL